jgi:hypothetical protein
MARAGNLASFVDVTDSTDTQFHMDTPIAKFCVINNAAVDRTFQAKQNVFCVPRRACTSFACGGPQNVRIVATFLGRPDSQVVGTVNMVCP